MIDTEILYDHSINHGQMLRSYHGGRFSKSGVNNRIRKKNLYIMIGDEQNKVIFILQKLLFTGYPLVSKVQ